TIVVSTAQRRLYLVLGNGQALSYGIGVGKAGFAWSSVTQITDKREWPDWTPPDQMLRRRPDLPHHMAGGARKPKGAPGGYLRAGPPHHQDPHQPGNHRPHGVPRRRRSAPQERTDAHTYR